MYNTSVNCAGGHSERGIFMRNPEILAVMVSLEALLETNNEKKALEVIRRVIAQVEVTTKKTTKTESKQD